MTRPPRRAQCRQSQSGTGRPPHTGASERSSTQPQHARKRPALFMESTTRQTARLRIVTPNPSSRPDTPVIGPDVVLDCEGGYTCECGACRREREALKRRGVRSLRPTYVKRGRAA